jgi:hypothetical protein
MKGGIDLKKSWKKPSLLLMGFLFAVSPMSQPFISLAGNTNNTTYYSENPKQYDQQLKEASDALQKAFQSHLEEDVKKAIDVVLSLPYSENYKSEEKGKLLDQLFDYINHLEDKTLKAKYGVYLTDKAVNRAKETLLYDDYELANRIVQSLPDGTVKTKYSSMLEEVKKKIDEEIKDSVFHPRHDELAQTPPIDFSKLKPEDFLPYDNTDTGDYLPGFEPKPKKPEPKPPVTLPEESYTENMNYVTEGGKCYREIVRITEGKKKIVRKELVTGLDTVFCSAIVMDEDNHHHKGNPYNEPYDFSKVRPAPPGSGLNIRTTKNDSYSSYSTNNQTNVSHETKQKEVFTLHYTLNRYEKDPYYYDTDLVVGEDNTITYSQQKDVLFQLAIRSGGKAVEDKDRFLVLLENKIIVIEDKGERIPVSSFDTILKGFKAHVKVMKTKVGQKTSS